MHMPTKFFNLGSLSRPLLSLQDVDTDILTTARFNYNLSTLKTMKVLPQWPVRQELPKNKKVEYYGHGDYDGDSDGFPDAADRLSWTIEDRFRWHFGRTSPTPLTSKEIMHYTTLFMDQQTVHYSALLSTSPDYDGTNLFGLTNSNMQQFGHGLSEAQRLQSAQDQLHGLVHNKRLFGDQYQWHYAVMTMGEMITMRENKALPGDRQHYTPLNYHFTPQEAIRHYYYLLVTNHERNYAMQDVVNTSLLNNLVLVCIPMETTTAEDHFDHFNRHYVEYSHYVRDRKPLTLSDVTMDTMEIFFMEDKTALRKFGDNYLTQNYGCFWDYTSMLSMETDFGDTRTMQFLLQNDYWAEVVNYYYERTMKMYDYESFVQLAHPTILDIMSPWTLNYIINNYEPKNETEKKAVNYVRNNYIERIARRITISELENYRSKM